VGVSLPPEVYALYKAFSQLSGQSMSSMLAEIAVTSAPALERVLRIAVAAKEAESSRKAGLQQAARQAEDELLPLLAQAQQTLGVALGHLEDAVGGHPSAPAPGRRAADPRPSNTGVRYPPKQGKKRRR
jgi:hypothetical protein